MSWYVYFLTADTFLIWYLLYFYLSAVTALCGAVGLQVSLLGLGIFRKKPVKDMSIRAIYPSIGLELPQQTSQLRMTGDCVQPVSSGRVQRCVWLCLVTLNSPNAANWNKQLWTSALELQSRAVKHRLMLRVPHPSKLHLSNPRALLPPS